MPLTSFTTFPAASLISTVTPPIPRPAVSFTVPAIAPNAWSTKSLSKSFLPDINVTGILLSLVFPFAIVSPSDEVSPSNVET